MKLLYEKLVEELAKRNLKCKIIAVGRSALELYGIEEGRFTKDIDFELDTDEEGWKVVEEVLGRLEILADFSEDIDRWGIVPMPEGYRERAVCVLRKGQVELCVLDPVDYILSKLRRGTAEDEEDALMVAKKFRIDQQAILERAKLIRPIKDVQFFLFKKRLERFLRENVEGPTLNMGL